MGLAGGDAAGADAEEPLFLLPTTLSGEDEGLTPGEIEAFSFSIALFSADLEQPAPKIARLSIPAKKIFCCIKVSPFFRPGRAGTKHNGRRAKAILISTLQSFVFLILRV